MALTYQGFHRIRLVLDLGHERSLCVVNLVGKVVLWPLDVFSSEELHIKASRGLLVAARAAGRYRLEK